MYFDAVSNSLFIANFGGHTVVRWVLADNHWTLVAGNINETNGSSSVLLNGPVGITLDPMGNIYITDSNTDHVPLFLASQSTGATRIVGSNATLLTNLFWPLLDNQLNLYVTASTNDRVQKFNRY
jgi:DNA-binding beta-propeller fold protein YncE